MLQLKATRFTLPGAAKNAYIYTMKKWLIPLLAVLFFSCNKNKNTAAPATGAEPLAKGINLSNWFNDYSDPSQFSTRFSFSTLSLIKQSGFTNVRIPIGPPCFLTRLIHHS